MTPEQFLYHEARLLDLQRYEDWLELCRFGPVLGQWTTLSAYFNDVLAGEHAAALSADEFQSEKCREDEKPSRQCPKGCDSALEITAVVPQVR